MGSSEMSKRLFSGIHLVPLLGVADTGATLQSPVLVAEPQGRVKNDEYQGCCSCYQNKSFDRGLASHIICEEKTFCHI